MTTRAGEPGLFHPNRRLWEDGFEQCAIGGTVEDDLGLIRTGELRDHMFEPQVQKQPRRRQQSRHDDGEGQRQPKPDRDLGERPADAHPPPSERSLYPALRSVSIDRSPNGRSILARR